MTEQRTTQQNKAVWKFYELLANELNDSGNDMRRTLKSDISIPWNKDTVHDFLWIPIQKAMYGKTSTTELTTKQIDEVYNVLNRHLGEKVGVHTPFPTLDNLIQDKK